MGTRDFRIVIVGGGPVGLIAAHILSQADIDFVVLEKHHTVFPELGNATALWPQTSRVLDQLRLFESLQPLKTPIVSKVILNHQGHVYSQNKSFYLPRENHGYAVDIYHRHELLKAFYDNLPEDDKAKILVNKKVTSIETSESSVRVYCADGSVEEGDMVVGADGVHSTTRQIARQLALEAGSRPSTVNAEKPWLTNYRVLYGSVPRTPDQTPGDAYESHGSGNCLQFFIGRDRAWFFVYSALEAPTCEHARYTQEDADAYAADRGDMHITPTLRFRDVYEKKHASGLTNLEEGVMKRWSWGRVVLVGDAAHKITPNIGWGFNSSVHDLVLLVNRLRALLKNHKGGDEQITTPALEALFSEYQAERMAHMNQTTNLSATYTRLSAWRTAYKRFLDCYIFPHVHADDLLVTYGIGAQIRTVPVLDWLDEPHFAEGWIPWEHLPLGGQKTAKSRQGGSRTWDLIETIMPTVVALL